MYFQFIHGSDSYLQVLDKWSCTYYVGGGSTFRTEAVASAKAPGQEMNLSNSKRMWSPEWKEESGELRRMYLGDGDGLRSQRTVLATALHAPTVSF